MKTTRKRWQFLWCDVGSPPANKNSHTWKSKIFRVVTFEKAMDLMLAFLKGKPFECGVDYECAAMHVRYSPKRHDAHFKNISTTGHELKAFIY